LEKKGKQGSRPNKLSDPSTRTGEKSPAGVVHRGPPNVERRSSSEKKKKGARIKILLVRGINKNTGGKWGLTRQVFERRADAVAGDA